MVTNWTKIYGFLPTPGRISDRGVVIPTPGCDSIIGTLGPFGRSIRDIELFCRAYSASCPWADDRSLVPCDILSPALGRQLQPDQPLRVGILLDDGVVSPLPPVRRVMSTVNQRLRDSVSVEVKPFKALDHAKAWEIIAANYFEDGGADIHKKCRAGSESLEPLTEWIIGQCSKSMLEVGSTLQERKEARDSFRQSYAAHWNSAEVDVLVAPVTPGTAPNLGTSKYWGYTAVWNLLSYPALALPASSLVGEINCEQDLAEEKYEPKNSKEIEVFKEYSASASAGMPVGLQVVAPRFHESMLFAAANIIECALTGKRRD